MYGQECMQTFDSMYLCRLGLIDSSGMRIYHTKQLREYDAGVLQVSTIIWLSHQDRETGKPMAYVLRTA